MSKKSRRATPVSGDLKVRLFEKFAESALRLDYSQDRRYYCPLCACPFEGLAGLTADHVPPQSLDKPTAIVLTCERCNNDSGTAQDRLFQAHLLHQLGAATGPTAPCRVRVTLGAHRVNATVWKDERGALVAKLAQKQRKETVDGFFAEYQAETGAEHLSLHTVVRLDERLIRWAVVREGFLLMFNTWGYWLLESNWAAELQGLLRTPGVPLHPGSVVEVRGLQYAVAPTSGEFLCGRTRSGRSCWLVPIVDNRAAVIPSDQHDGCLTLWTEVQECVDQQIALTVNKVVVRDEVKLHSLLRVERHDVPGGTPDHWVEVAPG